MSLHRYFIWSTLLKEQFEKSILTGDHLPGNGEDPCIWPLKYMMSATGAYMAYWYSGLYVVCEGWYKLNIHDDKIDELLKDDNRKTLEDFRHGTFHFQKDYMDKRFKGFLTTKGTVPWVRELSSEFGRWFRKNSEEQQRMNNSL